MSLTLHPDWLPTSLEETYRVLLKHAKDGQVTITPRQLMTELKLLSPAPVMKRLENLKKRGVIQFA
jgi:DNA-binding Lrp family transcriptional regulator